MDKLLDRLNSFGSFGGVGLRENSRIAGLIRIDLTSLVCSSSILSDDVGRRLQYMKVAMGNIATIRQGLSRSGRSVGARRGDARVALISGNNIQDDRIAENGVEQIRIALDDLTEKHLLLPYDVLVTGKSTSVKAAYVPPGAGRAIANSTLVVVRPDDADLGLYIWWFLTSRAGRRMVESRMVASASLSSLSPMALAEMGVPLPPAGKLRQFAALIEASERAYWCAREAADIRRFSVRDDLVRTLLGANSASPGGTDDAD